MNYHNIQKIRDYIEHVKTLDNYWRNLLSGTVEYYEKKLIKEYHICGTHPFPNEHINYQNSINKSNTV